MHNKLIRIYNLHQISDITRRIALVSFDVVSLFTNVPVERAKQIAYDRLLTDRSLPDRTTLTPKQVTDLLDFCLNATYIIILSYSGKFYKQTFGTAMDSPVSVTVANSNLVMEDVEDRAISSSDLKPPFWKRYIYDICRQG